MFYARFHEFHVKARRYPDGRFWEFVFGNSFLGVSFRKERDAIMIGIDGTSI